MAITQAISDEGYTPQSNLTSGTINSATRIPQEALDRQRQSRTIGQTVTPGVSAGVANMPTSGSGNMLSAFSSPGQQVALRDYSDYRSDVTAGMNRNMNPKSMTYGDWANYFASKGPSSTWDDNTWRMFAISVTPDDKDQLTINASENPESVPMSVAAKYYNLSGSTFSPVGTYQYKTMMNALAPWLDSRKAMADQEGYRLGYGGSGIDPMRPNMDQIGYYGYGDSEDKIRAIASGTRIRPADPNAWQGVDDRAYNPVSDRKYNLSTSQQLDEMRPYLEQLQSGEPYGIKVNGLTDYMKAREDVVPWFAYYMTEPAQAASPVGYRSSGASSDPLSLSVQKRLASRRSIR